MFRLVHTCMNLACFPRFFLAQFWQKLPRGLVFFRQKPADRFIKGNESFKTNLQFSRRGSQFRMSVFFHANKFRHAIFTLVNNVNKINNVNLSLSEAAFLFLRFDKACKAFFNGGKRKFCAFRPAELIFCIFQPTNPCFYLLIPAFPRKTCLLQSKNRGFFLRNKRKVR